MNAIFGHGGWSSQITMERSVLSEKDERGRWNVGYLASVRVTILSNGACHEDCGSGEGIDNNKVKAHEKAMKSAITDAMKRAARHFGERVGNAMYVKGAGIRTAPRTNKDALAALERKDALNLFGDQAVLRANHEIKQQCQSPPENRVVRHAPAGGMITNTTNNSNSTGGQKENWPQNRAGGQNTAVNTYQSRPSTTTGYQQQQQSVMPSPIASSHANRGSVVQQTHHNGNNNNNSSASYTAGAASARPAINPVPAVNTITPVPYNNGNIANQNNNSTNNNLMNAPQAPNLMAPPPRPIYNPGGNIANGVVQQQQQQQQQYGGSVNNVASAHNHPGAKRTFDGGNNVYNNGSGNSNINGTSDKRQKVNPYSNNNSNKRLSV